MAAAGQFSVGEKAYVPHTDKYYEAKVLKAEYRGESGWYYFLHYNGWNKKYDEWVEEIGLIKADAAAAAGAANASLPKGKKMAGGMGGASAGFIPTGVPVASLPALGAKRPAAKQGGGREHALGSASLAAGPAVGLDVEVPPLIKKHLVEDFEAVCEGGKLVPLPRSPCVADLMDQYVIEAHQSRDSSVDAEEEVAHGLMSYFDKALPMVLLYRAEHAQATQALADGQLPRSVYGAEHFARLLVKLPEIIPLGLLTDDQLATVATMVQDVMLWLADNTSSLFLKRDGYIQATE